jgi:hypothetical protein
VPFWFTWVYFWSAQREHLWVLRLIQVQSHAKGSVQFCCWGQNTHDCWLSCSRKTLANFLRCKKCDMCSTKPSAKSARNQV